MARKLHFCCWSTRLIKWSLIKRILKFHVIMHNICFIPSVKLRNNDALPCVTIQVHLRTFYSTFTCSANCLYIEFNYISNLAQWDRHEVLQQTVRLSVVWMKHICSLILTFIRLVWLCFYFHSFTRSEMSYM